MMMKIFPCGTPTSWYDTESVERFPNPASRHNHIRQEHHGRNVVDKMLQRTFEFEQVMGVTHQASKGSCWLVGVPA